MSDSKYKVEVISPDETSVFIRRIRGGMDPFNPQHRKMVLAEGFELKGTFELVARNVETGKVEWEHTQDNLVTDLGRLYFVSDGWANVSLGFMPSTETPMSTRMGVCTDGAQCFMSVNQGAGVVTAGTFTRNFGPISFGVPSPSINRTLGTVFVSPYNLGPDAAWGHANLLAYALLSPPKIQTTVQTVELNYKLSMNPII